MKCLAFLALLTLAQSASAQTETYPPPLPAETGQPTTLQVITAPASGVNISGITLICKGGETILKAEGEYESFEWNTGSTERIIKVREEGIYEVKAKTKHGCTFTGSVNVTIRPCT